MSAAVKVALVYGIRWPCGHIDQLRLLVPSAARIVAAAFPDLVLVVSEDDGTTWEQMQKEAT